MSRNERSKSEEEQWDTFLVPLCEYIYNNKVGGKWAQVLPFLSLSFRKVEPGTDSVESQKHKQEKNPPPTFAAWVVAGLEPDWLNQ